MKTMLVVLTLAAAALTACGQEAPVAQVQAPVVAVTTPSATPTPAPTPACSTLTHFAGQGTQALTVYAPAHATIAWTTSSATPKSFKVTGTAYADQFWTWSLEQQGKHSVPLSNPAGCYALQWVLVTQGTASHPEVYPAPSSWTFDVR